MKRLILLATAGVVALSGCIVAVERRDNPPRHYDPPPPPPVEQAQVTVAWNDARVVFLQEYYGCDWDDVGCFDYYETRYGIPEDDLFVLFYIARHRNVNFHEVVFTYESCGRNIFQVCRRTGFPVWDLYVDIPPGTWCPPAYRRCYGYYWRRDSGVILTNYDCQALFWLRFSVNYYGWSHHDVFTRWERCVSTGDRFTVVIHREYSFAGRGRYNVYQKPVVRIQERPERGGNIAVAMKQKREQSVKKVEVDVNVRVQKGDQKIARPPAAHVIREKEAERRRTFEKEREFEKKELERTKHERPPPPKEKEKDPPKEREKDPPKRDPPPPKEREKDPPKRDPPPPKEREKDPPKRDPPPPKEREKDPPKEREKDPPKKDPPPPPKDREKDPPKKDPPPPPKDREKDPPKKDDKKDDGDKKKDDGGRKGGGRGSK